MKLSHARKRGSSKGIEREKKGTEREREEAVERGERRENSPLGKKGVDFWLSTGN